MFFCKLCGHLMDIERFDFLARGQRSKNSVVAAARLVLVHGISIQEVAQVTEVRETTLSRFVRLILDLDKDLNP